MTKQSQRSSLHPRESVWDYPRPPRVDACDHHVRVVAGGITVADSKSTVRILETSHPPVYYIPPDDVLSGHLVLQSDRSFCEWKGTACYYAVVIDNLTIDRAAWFYPHPLPRYQKIASYVAFYPGKVDACFVDEERVVAQPGNFYGGWITSNIEGPFKGPAGTSGW